MILDYTAIGRRVRAAREKCGMTQEALAAKSDLSVPHISHIETASTKLALPSIISIANALSVSVDELLCDNVLHSKVVFEKEAMEIFEGCSDFEIRILVDLLKASKSTLRSSEQFQKNLRYLKKSEYHKTGAHRRNAVYSCFVFLFICNTVHGSKPSPNFTPKGFSNPSLSETG